MAYTINSQVVTSVRWLPVQVNQWYLWTAVHCFRNKPQQNRTVNFWQWSVSLLMEPSLGNESILCRCVFVAASAKSGHNKNIATQKYLFLIINFLSIAICTALVFPECKVSKWYRGQS